MQSHWEEIETCSTHTDTLPLSQHTCYRPKSRKGCCKSSVLSGDHQIPSSEKPSLGHLVISHQCFSKPDLLAEQAGGRCPCSPGTCTHWTGPQQGTGAKAVCPLAPFHPNLYWTSTSRLSWCQESPSFLQETILQRPPGRSQSQSYPPRGFPSP